MAGGVRAAVVGAEEVLWSESFYHDSRNRFGSCSRVHRVVVVITSKKSIRFGWICGRNTNNPPPHVMELRAPPPPCTTAQRILTASRVARLDPLRRPSPHRPPCPHRCCRKSCKRQRACARCPCQTTGGAVRFNKRKKPRSEISPGVRHPQAEVASQTQATCLSSHNFQLLFTLCVKSGPVGNFLGFLGESRLSHLRAGGASGGLGGARLAGKRRDGGWSNSLTSHPSWRTDVATAPVGRRHNENDFMPSTETMTISA